MRTIEIEYKLSDWALDILALLLLMLLLGLPAFYYNSLPDIIPKHFGLNGEPDNFGSKAVIWVLPLVGFLSFMLFFFLGKNPDKFNLPVKVTPTNAKTQFSLAITMMRCLNVLVLGILCYFTYGTIEIALGNQSALSVFDLPIFLTLLFGGLGYYFWKASKMA